MAREIVTRNFSRSAQSYDAYATVQSQVGEQLLAMLDAGNCTTILDLGCGTGAFTAMLRERYADAEIQAVDISPAMIEVAARKLKHRGVSLRVADVATMDWDGPYDLVAANASLHWFDDLPALLPKLARACGAHGTLLFSAFGPETYRELNTCLRELWGPDAVGVAERFHDGAALEALLQTHFREAVVRQLRHTATYNGLWDLLRTIKYTGTQGSGWEGRRLTRSDVAALENVYLERYDRIAATYQVFYGKASEILMASPVAGKDFGSLRDSRVLKTPEV